MSTWLLPFTDLTLDQKNVVMLPPTENRLVHGFPGSGKTLVLVHRAAYLSEHYRVSPEKFRVFVFTNVIKEYIRSGFQFLRLPDDSVCTFDHWCYLTFEKYISKMIPRRGKNIDFEAIRKAVLALVRRRRDLQKTLDFVLVDEGQDLNAEYYEILALVSNHTTVFVDPLQKIFDGGADRQAIVEALGLRKSGSALLGAYRNAPNVAYLASHFILDSGARVLYLNQMHTEQKIREKPLCFIAGDHDEEVDRLAEIVKQRQVMNERVGIIVSSNRLVYGLAEGLAERGVVVERAVKKKYGKAFGVECDFNNDLPKIATFYMAKGLTFETVILPRLTGRAFTDTPWKSTGDSRCRLMFVGSPEERSGYI